MTLKNEKNKRIFLQIMTNIKKNLSRIIRYLPYKGRFIKTTYNNIKFFIIDQKIISEIKNKKYTITNIDKILWINPNEIIFHTYYQGKNKKTDFKDCVFDPYKYRGKVLDGEWDLSPHKFTDLDIFISIKEHLDENKDWSETKFYKESIKEIEQGIYYWGFNNKTELIEKCNKMDKLIESIRENGYVPNSLKEENLNNSMKKIDEITVNIGRDGQLLFNDGRHRLSIAKILRIEKIPVRILVRHYHWQIFYEKLLLLSKKSEGKLYQPALHPDLMDIPYWHDCYDRFEYIKKKINKKRGKLLDIGANIGFFCQKFEELGFECYAVEPYEEAVYIMKKLKIFNKANFKIINRSIFDTKLIDETQFDTVLALNIFHHFLKTEFVYFQFINLLKKLKTKEIFFEPHNYNEPQMKNAYKNFNNLDFVNFIQQYTGLDKFEMIYKAKDNRNIYHLYKT